VNPTTLAAAVCLGIPVGWAIGRLGFAWKATIVAALLFLPLYVTVAELSSTTAAWTALVGYQAGLGGRLLFDFVLAEETSTY